MLEMPGFDSKLKLIDFGLATIFEPGRPLRLSCGTTHYTAPEVHRCNYNEKCDIWSIGIVFYMLCTGSWPFFDTSEDRLQKLLAGGPNVFEPGGENEATFKKRRGDVSSIMNLLKDLLCPQEADRLSAKEILERHAWIEKARNDPIATGSGCKCTVL